MIELIPINDIKPSAYNPRKVDPKRLVIIELSLRKLGYLLPIYSDADGEILSGHQRHYVSKKMGVKKVPVSFIESLELPKRKAVNILFNRATNDFSHDDTCSSVTDQLNKKDIFTLANSLKDIPVNSDEFYPCLYTKPVELWKLIEVNRGRWNRYSRNLAGSLYTKKILMPVVCTPDYKVVNGIGRVEVLAEKKAKDIPVVIISYTKAEFAEAMLNLTTMDFDIHNKYADLLRHNSFRRAFTNRAGLGIGFYVAAFGNTTSKEFIFTRERITKWKLFYGTKILDFGAGHLSDTNILRSIGVDVTPFEPYKIRPGSNDIDKDESIKLTLEFLEKVKSGYQWDSIFISSVLNSVPFIQDRKHIVTILSALSSDKTKVYVWTMNIKHKSHIQLQTQPLSHTDSKQIRFKLDYEPGIILGGFNDKPKVQKYHTPAEVKELFSTGFEEIKIKNVNDTVLAVCSKPKTDPGKLSEAIKFEFNLPYPDGSRMNLVKYASSCFNERRKLE